MKFEIHGDENGVTVTTDMCIYRLSPTRHAEFSIDRETDWGNNAHYAPYPRDCREFFTLKMELGAYQITQYTDVPMTYGEGTWMH